MAHEWSMLKLLLAGEDRTRPGLALVCSPFRPHLFLSSSKLDRYPRPRGHIVQPWPDMDRHGRRHRDNWTSYSDSATNDGIWPSAGAVDEYVVQAVRRPPHTTRDVANKFGYDRHGRELYMDILRFPHGDYWWYRLVSHAENLIEPGCRLHPVPRLAFVPVAPKVSRSDLKSLGSFSYGVCMRGERRPWTYLASNGLPASHAPALIGPPPQPTWPPESLVFG
jgi:hypothetical protein